MSKDKFCCFCKNIYRPLLRLKLPFSLWFFIQLLELSGNNYICLGNNVNSFLACFVKLCFSYFLFYVNTFIIAHIKNENVIISKSTGIILGRLSGVAIPDAFFGQKSDLLALLPIKIPPYLPFSQSKSCPACEFFR